MVEAHHPLSPNDEDERRKSEDKLEGNQEQAEEQEGERELVNKKSYFHLKAHSDLILNQPTTSSSSTTTTTTKKTDQQQQLPELIQKLTLNSQTPTRIRLIRDDTLKQTTESSNPTQTRPPSNSRSSSYHSFNIQSNHTPTSKSTNKQFYHQQQNHYHHHHHHHHQKLKISLSDQPHLIPTKSQLLLELKKVHNPDNLPELVDQNALNSLMLSLIRELSLKLNQTQEELKTSQLEINGLKDLLINTYSVGSGEIERCLVRARVPDPPPKTDMNSKTSTSNIVKPSTWQVQLNDQHEEPPSTDNLHLNLSTSSSFSSSLGPSCSTAQLDLDDLREAMSDNPCFDTVSSSSCRSRSQLTSPASLDNHIPESPLPLNLTQSTKKKSNYHSPSTSKLFHPSSILNGKYRKSAPIPPILPPSSDHHDHHNYHQHQHQHQHHHHHHQSIEELTAERRGTITSSSTLHTRTTSIGSSLSGVSSAPGTRQPPNNVWGLYGWKWNKRNKINSAPVGAQIEVDGPANGEDCVSPENELGGGPLDDPTLIGPASVDRQENSQIPQSPTRPKRSPTDASSSSTILSGLFDSLTRRKRAESNHSHLQQPSLQSFNSRSTVPGSSEEQFPVPIDVSSSLAPRSPSLILNSSASINTQNTSSNSSCSVDHPSTHPQLDPLDHSHQADLTLSLPSLKRSDSRGHEPSSQLPSESELLSAAPSDSHSAPSSSDLTPPLGGTDRLMDNPDNNSLDPSSSISNQATSSQATPLAKISRNPITTSDPSTVNRRPSLINLKSPAESFVSGSKGLPTLATHADMMVHGERSQLPAVLSGLSGDNPKHQLTPELNNTGDHTHASPDGDSSSYSQSVNSSLTGPELSDRNNTRLQTQPSHQNLSIRSSKSSVVTSASQMKSKPQVKLTQPATTKSYLSTATGTIGKALSSNPSSEITIPAEFEPNVTTVPKAAFGRLASVYFKAHDSRAYGSPSRSSNNKTGSTSILFTGQAPHHRSLGNTISGIDHGADGFSTKQSSTTAPPSEPINHHGLNKLKFLPPLSNSTMELSTFINPQSNPPPFSNISRDEEARGLDAPPGPSPGAADDEPIVDRFGFIVDVKYGLKLMRKSRDKKKQLAKERLAALEEQHPSEPPQSSTEDPIIPPEPPMDPALSSETSSTSFNSPSSRVLSLAPTEENSKFNSTRCDASVEGSDLDHTPMMTTALPIKSQVDVEAELSSLREALGLSPAIKPAGKDLQSSTADSADTSLTNQAPSIDPVVESSTQSIRRLLFQLNEMQNMLEKKQMEAWGQFITKRRMKLMRVSNSSSPHILSPSPISDPSVGNKMTIQGTGAVSPASVGAFLGTVPRQGGSSSGSASSPTGVMPKAPHSTGGHLGSKRQSLGESTERARDLITCHDDNLIGIASMGLSNDNNKKALKDEWKEFKALVIQGIPISLRPKIWLECSGASELKEPGYYHDLLNLHDGEEGLCLNQIECDVTRTLPTNVYFGGDGPGVSKLRRVLAAMSWHNPVVGYCQGMNMVAATLLLTIPSEEDAFWILVCIVDKILPSHYYTSHLLTSQADQRVLKVLVSKYLAELADHFDALDVELPAITFGWFLSLFADALPIQTLLLLLFRISLALLKINQTTILSYDSPASLYAYMRGPMTLSSHHADLLINVATVDFADIKNSLIVSLRDNPCQPFVSLLLLQESSY
ncbi:hypothetical protein PGTUg99_019292 [Puccinia graminis f. sp. tritici]|uniref:Rab-GAP TBC domain-containing protein n=1 Tax=Puccinia graminis f. sp. tritici TaxID=56615 RepID=A0A5B0QH02_PUCGR|nr:hypothetical protein PGTUg99_019292 [Puccinia graminis f. sp. tritici]